MTKNKFGELVFDENDIVDQLMTNGAVPHGLIVDNISVESNQLDQVPVFYTSTDQSISVEEFDAQNQINWYMPDSYKELDIAEHVLSLCTTNEQLQRVGKELLLYQQKNLFDLLKYLKYLVDTMKQNKIIWGVGRGSSVASYVLYLLGIHRIDSIYYDLDPEEFLR